MLSLAMCLDLRGLNTCHSSTSDTYSHAMNRYKLHTVKRPQQIYVRFKDDYIINHTTQPKDRERLRRMRGVVTQLDYSGERVVVDWGDSTSESGKWVYKDWLIYE